MPQPTRWERNAPLRPHHRRGRRPSRSAVGAHRRHPLRMFLWENAYAQANGRIPTADELTAAFRGNRTTARRWRDVYRDYRRAVIAAGLDVITTGLGTVERGTPDPSQPTGAPTTCTGRPCTGPPDVRPRRHVRPLSRWFDGLNDATALKFTLMELAAEAKDNGDLAYLTMGELAARTECDLRTAQRRMSPNWKPSARSRRASSRTSRFRCSGPTTARRSTGSWAFPLCLHPSPDPTTRDQPNGRRGDRQMQPAGPSVDSSGALSRNDSSLPTGSTNGVARCHPVRALSERNGVAPCPPVSVSDAVRTVTRSRAWLPRPRVLTHPQACYRTKRVGLGRPGPIPQRHHVPST